MTQNKYNLVSTEYFTFISGPCAIDYIILDVDKGEIPKDQMLGYIEACLSEMFDKGVMEEDINLWFSGTGFHIEMKNVFG